jgi:DNA-directed RNA polymerase subunit D
MEIVTKDLKGKLEVDLKETTPSFANALRRIILSEVPVTAVEEVSIKENNSALQDELLAHRLSLIPVEGEGIVKLQAEGPKTVTSGDLQAEGKLKIPNKEIPIIELLDNQKVDLSAKVIEGTGKEHAKWQAAIVGYKYKNPKNIHLIIESYSYLTEKEILKKSLEILKNRAEHFKEEISKYKSF